MVKLQTRRIKNKELKIIIFVASICILSKKNGYNHTFTCTFYRKNEIATTENDKSLARGLMIADYSLHIMSIFMTWRLRSETVTSFLFYLSMHISYPLNLMRY